MQTINFIMWCNGPMAEWSVLDPKIPGSNSGHFCSKRLPLSDCQIDANRLGNKLPQNQPNQMGGWMQ